MLGVTWADRNRISHFHLLSFTTAFSSDLSFEMVKYPRQHRGTLATVKVMVPLKPSPFVNHNFFAVYLKDYKIIIIVNLKSGFASPTCLSNSLLQHSL